jgi:hypothetical protein
LNVLIACEFSGVVRDEFHKKGHNAWSCDFLDSEIPGQHYTGDISTLLNLGWDLMIAFPPCTHLCSSGARWFKKKREDGRQQDAIEFFMKLINSDIPKIAVENPIGIMSTIYKKPDQIIQPWQFGHGETKATCLWLKNLPLLQPTNIVLGRENRIWKMGPSPLRSKNRSRTYYGVAKAMAEQWG